MIKGVRWEPQTGNHKKNEAIYQEYSYQGPYVPIIFVFPVWGSHFTLLKGAWGNACQINEGGPYSGLVIGIYSSGNTNK